MALNAKGGFTAVWQNIPFIFKRFQGFKKQNNYNFSNWISPFQNEKSKGIKNNVNS